MISPLAYIHPEAKIGENVEIGPFVFIDKNVVIGDNNTIMPNANILYGSRIGNGNTIFPGAVIGAIPQDLKFRGEETTAEIGDNNTIRENVTINRGTAAKGKTIVGSNNLLMEGVHVAHDAIIGSGCIIGNATKMAGEIIIDDNAIISGAVLMHQFCRVGGYVMVQGGSRFSKDIPPYIIAGREPIAYAGINIVGLRRRGFSSDVIRNIKENLFWAFFYNCIGIPLAAGVLYPAFQIRLNPMFGAAAMSLSSIFVVGNALRLRGFKSGFTPLKTGTPEAARTEQETTQAAVEGEQCILEAPAEQNNRQDVKQEKERTNTMTKVISIEGMMCNHCTGTVQKALEAVEGVKAVTMSLEQKNATVELASDVADEVLTKAVVDAGYEVKGVTEK